MLHLPDLLPRAVLVCQLLLGVRFAMSGMWISAGPFTSTNAMHARVFGTAV